MTATTITIFILAIVATVLGVKEVLRFLRRADDKIDAIQNRAIEGACTTSAMHLPIITKILKFCGSIDGDALVRAVDEALAVCNNKESMLLALKDHLIYQVNERGKTDEGAAFVAETCLDSIKVKAAIIKALADEKQKVAEAETLAKLQEQARSKAK